MLGQSVMQNIVTALAIKHVTVDNFYFNRRSYKVCLQRMKLCLRLGL